MYCSCGAKLVLIGKVQGGSRMYLCLSCLEITIKDRYDKEKASYQMDWFIKWKRETKNDQDLLAKMVSQQLGIEERL